MEIEAKIHELTECDSSGRVEALLPEAFKLAMSLDQKGGYSRIGPLTPFFNQVETEEGRSTVEALARGLLVRMATLECWRPTCQVPQSIRDRLELQRERIIEETMEKPIGHYLPSNDAFLKDFSILRGKTLPLNTGVVDTRTSLWRRPLVTGPISQRLNFLKLLLREPKGVRFFLQHHIHSSMLDQFNREGRLRTYQLVAELLEANPEYKGFVGASWFYDPALEKISPHLSYLANDPLSGGAYRFYIEKDLSGSALAKSKTRKELYEKGKYVPRLYILAWHRKDLLKWSSNRF